MLPYTKSGLVQPRSAAISASLLPALSLIRGVKHVKVAFLYGERDDGVAATYFPGIDVNLGP